MGKVKLCRHTIRDDGRQADIGAEAVDGFNEDGRWNHPRNTAWKNNPRVHGLNFEIRGIVDLEGHDHRSVSTVLGSRDGQLVVSACEVHGVNHHCSSFVDGQLLVVVHERRILCVHRGADVHWTCEFIESNHVDPRCKRQAILGHSVRNTWKDGEIRCCPIVVSFSTSKGLDAIGGQGVAIDVKGLRAEVSVIERKCPRVGEGDVEHGAATHQDLHGQRATAFSSLAPYLAFGQGEVEFVHAVGVGQIHLHRGRLVHAHRNAAVLNGTAATAHAAVASATAVVAAAVSRTASIAAAVLSVRASKEVH